MTFKSYRKQAEKLARKKAGRALTKAAEVLMYTDAQKVTPLLTGELRESAAVGEPRGEGKQVIVDVGYTDPKAPYVHERPWTKPTTPGTFSKWLERTSTENASKYERIVAEEMAK